MTLLSPQTAANAIPGMERVQKRLAASLALTAGYVDGYGLLVLGTYLSFMSGNTTMAAVTAGQAHFQAAVFPAVAILFFVSGSFVGTVITRSRPDHAHRILFGLIAALLVLALPLGGHPALRSLNIAVLSLGMGMINPALSHIGAENVSLTFMTGTLGRIGSHLALALERAPVPGSEGAWDSHLYRARMGAQIWAAFASGAVLSAILTSIAKSVALVPAIATMLALAVLVPVRAARG